MEVPPLECHKPELSLASPNELDGRVRAIVVLCKPPFTDHSAETGTKTGGEAGEPKAIDRDRETGGLEGKGWVGYAR